MIMIGSKICVLGMGYVGLPLAVAFAREFEVIGFDRDEGRIDALNSGFDETGEVSGETLEACDHLMLTHHKSLIATANVFILAVPTPVNDENQPDLKPLISAIEIVSSVIKPGDYVVVESTVYPGVTEEICAPLLAELSGLKFNEDFFMGYSPERINPGDKEHSLTSMCKVTSGSTPAAAKNIDYIYSLAIDAGTYLAPSIKVAEAAKVIENAQRDLNVAFMNEISAIFALDGLDTTEVLEAASTKWNFINFRPGLVGGHCIGVDPYYLSFRSQQLGLEPKLILAGREVNEGVPRRIFVEAEAKLNKNSKTWDDIDVLILGLTFKENVPDVRNSKSTSLVELFTSAGARVEVDDPMLSQNALAKFAPATPFNPNSDHKYDLIVLSVAHEFYIAKSIQWYRSKLRDGGCFFDLKSVFRKTESEFRL